VPENEQDENSGKQVSEVQNFGSAADANAPIAPEDATAGYPDGESGEAQEGTAGPDAAPRHGRPQTGDQATDPGDDAQGV
jgi:hypothetical protein